MRPGLIEDRAQAGRLLAGRLMAYAGKPDCIVAALPRGGVVVGAGIAAGLHLPLDVVIVRKLGVPGQPELAMGAIASGGVQVMNEDVVQNLDVGEKEIAAVTKEELRELERRERAYRGDRPTPDFAGKTVIVADDGIATGATASAAIQALRAQHAARIVVATAVAPPDTVRRLEQEADEVVCLFTPSPFHAIGLWFIKFPQISDGEVRDLLAAACRA